MLEPNNRANRILEKPPLFPGAIDNPASDNIIVVAGSGRSGTTWLGNIVAGDELLTYFEPLDYRRVPSFTGLGLRPYFRPDEGHEEWRKVIEKMFNGILSDSELRNTNEHFIPEKKTGVLIKEIRANGILKWLQNNFILKIIFILRHPCAVSLSRLHCKWVAEVDSFFSNPRIIEDLEVDLDYLKSLSRHPLYAHVIMWCFENAVPLRQFGDSIPLFRYEALMTDNGRIVPEMLNTLGLRFDSARQHAFQELSNMSTRTIIDATEMMNGWRCNISTQETATIAEIVAHFHMDSLYEIE